MSRCHLIGQYKNQEVHIMHEKFHMSQVHLQLQASTTLADINLKKDIGLQKNQKKLLLMSIYKLISNTENSNDFQKTSCSHEKNPGKHNKVLWDQTNSMQTTSAKIRKYVTAVHMRAVILEQLFYCAKAQYEIYPTH